MNVFNTLTLAQIFWKTTTFFEILENRLLVEGTSIESVSFLYKTAISEANVKINRMVRTKWTYRKEQSFANNYFIFRNFCFSLRVSCKALIWYTNYPNVHVCTFCKRWSFIWQCFFPVSILKAPIVNWGENAHFMVQPLQEVNFSLSERNPLMC